MSSSSSSSPFSSVPGFTSVPDFTSDSTTLREAKHKNKCLGCAVVSFARECCEASNKMKRKFWRLRVLETGRLIVQKKQTAHCHPCAEHKMAIFMLRDNHAANVHININRQQARITEVEQLISVYRYNWECAKTYPNNETAIKEYRDLYFFSNRRLTQAKRRYEEAIKAKENYSLPNMEEIEIWLAGSLDICLPEREHSSDTVIEKQEKAPIVVQFETEMEKKAKKIKREKVAKDKSLKITKQTYSEQFKNKSDLTSNEALMKHALKEIQFTKENVITDSDLDEMTLSMIDKGLIKRQDAIDNVLEKRRQTLKIEEEAKRRIEANEMDTDGFDFSSLDSDFSATEGTEEDGDRRNL